MVEHLLPSPGAVGFGFPRIEGALVGDKQACADSFGDELGCHERGRERLVVLLHVLDANDALIRNDVHVAAAAYEVGIFLWAEDDARLAAGTEVLLVLDQHPIFVAGVVPVVELFGILPRGEDLFGGGFEGAFCDDRRVPYVCCPVN